MFIELNLYTCNTSIFDINILHKKMMKIDLPVGCRALLYSDHFEKKIFQITKISKH